MAIFLLILVIIQIWAFFLLGEDLNLFNNSSFTSYQSFYNIIRNLFKASLPVYFVFAPKVKSGDQASASAVYLGILLAIYCCLQLIEWFQPVKVNFYLGVQLRVMDHLYFWLTLCALTQVSYDNNSKPDNISLIYVAVGLVAVLYMAYYLEVRKCLPYALINLREKKTQTNFSRYLFTLCVVIERSNEDFYRDVIIFAFRSLYLDFKALPAFADLTQSTKDLLINFNQSSQI